MYSAYNLNKQGDNIQPRHSPFPIRNQSVVVGDVCQGDIKEPRVAEREGATGRGEVIEAPEEFGEHIIKVYRAG